MPPRDVTSITIAKGTAPPFSAKENGKCLPSLFAARCTSLFRPDGFGGRSRLLNAPPGIERVSIDQAVLVFPYWAIFGELSWARRGPF
jgi:hypothetical protein